MIQFKTLSIENKSCIKQKKISTQLKLQKISFTNQKFTAVKLKQINRMIVTHSVAVQNMFPQEKMKHLERTVL